MADIINLRRARKAQARVAAETAAAANRLRHGRTGAEKRAGRTERERLETFLDGARIEGGDEEA